MSLTLFLYEIICLLFLQILYAKDADQRSTTFERSIMMGQEYQRRTRMLILRSAMLKNHIHVKVNLSFILNFAQALVMGLGVI